MKFKIIEVPNNKIESENLFFKISTEVDIEDLVHSIGDIGLLSYPYLVMIAGKYRIISGFRRILACRFLGYRNIVAKVIFSNISLFECAKIAISDNALQRELNIVEKSRCYHLLKTTSPDMKSVFSLGNSLGIPVSRAAFKKIEPINSLGKFVVDGILGGYVAFPIAIKMGNMEALDALTLVDLFKRLNTTLSNQRKILELLLEISSRDNVSLENLITRQSVNNIINKDISNLQKAVSLREHFENIRYPTIHAVISKFRRKLDDIKLSHRVKLTPPKFFEGSSFKLELIFDSSEELEKHRGEIQKVINILPSLKKYN